MRIGIDCRTIGVGNELVGVGQYALFLVQELLRQDRGNEYVLFFDEQMLDHKIREIVGGGVGVKIVKLPRRTVPFVSTHVGAVRAIAREELDVFHAPDGHVPYFYCGRTVITIHDLVILRHPEWFPENAFERFISTRVLLRRAIARAQRIIVPSQSTVKDLQAFYGVGSERVRVIPLAPALPQESRPPANAPAGPYFLFVGTIEPRKNLPRLISAFQKIDDRAVRLVIAGKSGWKNRAIMDAIKKTERVEHLGCVSSEEKRWLMEHALAFIFPSFYEGFGLPVLEAMSVGTPVVTSNAGSLPEVAGNAAFLVDPDDEAALNNAMEQFVSNVGLRERFGRAGRVHAEKFSWQRTARETIRAYREAGG